ncbi:MAG TPA: hypothetical protein VGD43_01990, partial [Micromonospora sp.]
MTTSRPRPASRVARMLSIPAVVVLGAGTLGCGIIDTVQNAVDTAGVLSGFADRLGKASQLTYTAKYKLTAGEGGTVTLVQAPPRSAIVNGDQRLIFTPEHMTVCDGKQCQQAPNTAAAAGAADAGLVAGVAGPGFVTPELALGLVAAAALVPGSDVSTANRTIAGQDSLCAEVTGIKDPNADANGGTGGELLEDFSVCVTEAGVLAAFDGKSNTGERIAIELVSYSDQASSKAFQPPAGAEVVDVTQLPTS